MGDATEMLRRMLVTWYRRGQPWRTEPTLEMFRAGLDATSRRQVADLLDALIARHGPGTEVQDLRLRHLIELN